MSGSTPTTISVVGLGKLGACVAVACAARGKRVIGVDVRAEAVEAVNAGRPPVVEPGYDETLAGAQGRLTATLDVAAAVAASEVTFVVVPTPSEPNGAFSAAYAKEAFAGIGRALRSKSGWHLVVMTSTVLPGQTRQVLIPALEEASGKRAGVDFGVCYSPAFIALGSVIRDFLNPDFVIVGESDARAGETLTALYAEVLENGAPTRRMSLENGELSKIAVNTFVTTKITFANMIADLCERIPGGDVDVVTDAVGMDRRIGRRYLTGGLGYGGPCFPRDNQALSYLAQALDTSAELAEGTDRANRAIPGRVLDRLRDESGQLPGRVAVLGLAYKPSTSVIEASQGVWLAKALAEAGCDVTAYDVLALNEARRELGASVRVMETLADAVVDAEVVLVCIPDPAFHTTLPAALSASGHPTTVIDFWRTLEREVAGIASVRYVPVGRYREDGMDEPLAQLWREPVERASVNAHKVQPRRSEVHPEQVGPQEATVSL